MPSAPLVSVASSLPPPPVPLQQKGGMGRMDSLGREKRGTYQAWVAGWPYSAELILPHLPPKDKHSMEVWIKNKPLSDETSFSWAPRDFSKDLLSHSFIPEPYHGINSFTCHKYTGLSLPHLIPSNLRCSWATNSPHTTLASPFPTLTPTEAISGSCPTLHDRLYLCSIRISRTLSANQIFFAVTSPPDQRGRKQRIRMALISDSANPVHFFTILLVHP